MQLNWRFGCFLLGFDLVGLGWNCWKISWIWLGWRFCWIWRFCRDRLGGRFGGFGYLARQGWAGLEICLSLEIWLDCPFG